MLFAKLLLAYCVFALLRQLLTGKAYGGGLRILKIRLSERPGQRVWWGPTWYYKDEWPQGWWGGLIFNGLLIVVLVLIISGKFPKPPSQERQELLARLVFEFIGGLVAVSLIWHLCRLIWTPSRSERKVLGVGSLRTVSMYVACVLSAAIIAVMNLRTGYRLWFLFFIPFGLLMLGLLSAQIDSGQSTIQRSRW
jgi:hypothetical protein